MAEYTQELAPSAGAECILCEKPIVKNALCLSVNVNVPLKAFGKKFGEKPFSREVCLSCGREAYLKLGKILEDAGMAQGPD